MYQGPEQKMQKSDACSACTPFSPKSDFAILCSSVALLVQWEPLHLRVSPQSPCRETQVPTEVPLGQEYELVLLGCLSIQSHFLSTHSCQAPLQLSGTEQRTRQQQPLFPWSFCSVGGGSSRQTCTGYVREWRVSAMQKNKTR